MLRDPLIDSIVEGVIGTDAGPDMRVWATLVSVISPANGTTITVPDAKSPTAAFRSLPITALVAGLIDRLSLAIDAMFIILELIDVLVVLVVLI